VLTVEQKQSVDVWFAEYDELSKTGNIDGMADMAMFPIHVITDDSSGNGYAEYWNREQFIHTMTKATKSTPKDMEMRTVRTPFFLSNNLVVVITDAVIIMNKQEQTMRYADVLVKVDGKWKFQTMAQSGWGDMLKAHK
jgi:hypothetical protein